MVFPTALSGTMVAWYRAGAGGSGFDCGEARQQVVAGDRLLVLEAMKMETQVVAPFSGKVRQIMTIPNVQVGYWRLR